VTSIWSDAMTQITMNTFTLWNEVEKKIIRNEEEIPDSTFFDNGYDLLHHHNNCGTRQANQTFPDHVLFKLHSQKFCGVNHYHQATLAWEIIVNLSACERGVLVLISFSRFGNFSVNFTPDSLIKFILRVSHLQPYETE
jgi:hypothetical protein